MYNQIEESFEEVNLIMLKKFIEFTKSIISTSEFMEKFRKSKKDFTRNRKVSFVMNILLIFACLKRSVQTGIDQFLIDMDTEFDTYSKQAFSKGRQRILPEAFKELHRISTEFFYKEADYKTYCGYRILAVDGSKIDLPYNKELMEIYGCQKPTNNLIQSLTSCLTDVLNNVVLDGIMAPCNGNERELAKQHILNPSKIKTSKDIILFDRGYPSAGLMQYIEQPGCKYIMRCNTSFLAGMKKYYRNDGIIKHKFKKNNIELTFRVLQFPISCTTTEILVTNILEEFTINDFKKLYNMRWGIEKTYNCIKNKFCLESFSGTKPVCILQDFYANLYLYNALAMLMYENNKKLAEKNDTETKYTYKTNENQAVNKIRETFIKAVMCKSKTKSNKLFAKVYKQLQKELIPVRPNRIYNRKSKHPGVKFSQNQKS